MISQTPGQLTRRMIATAGGALAQLVKVVTVSQPPSKPQLGYVVSRIG